MIRRATEEFQSGIDFYPSGRELTDLAYADDMALMAERPEELQRGVNAIVKYGASYGLVLKASKSKVLTLQTSPPLQYPIRIAGEPLENVDSFCYLGSIVSSSASCDKDVSQRIGKAASAFNLLYRCLWSTNIRNEVKFKVYKTAISPILTYASSTWTMTKTLGEKIDVAERSFIRRILGYSWVDHKTNESLYAEWNELSRRCKANGHAVGIPSVRARGDRLRQLGHILRRHNCNLTKLMLLAEPRRAWKRRRGRNRIDCNETVHADLVAAKFDDIVRKSTKVYGRPINNTWRSANWLKAVDILADDRTMWRRMCSCDDVEGGKRCQPRGTTEK